MKQFNKIDNNFIEIYKEFQRGYFANGKEDILRKFRTKAFNDFKNSGIPTKNNEHYKYTDVNGVFDKDINISISKPKSFITPKKTDNINTYTVLLQNGWFIKHNVDIKGVIICGLQYAAKKYKSLFFEFFGKTISKYNGITALNTMLTTNGLFVYIPKSVRIDKPIQILNTFSLENDTLQNTRVLIVADANSNSKFIYKNDTPQNKSIIINNFSEIFVEPNAHTEFYLLQNNFENVNEINSTYVKQKRDSSFLNHTISISGLLIRNNLQINQNDENCETNLFGLYYAKKNSHIDNFTAVDHKKPNCTSNEHYKGIIGNGGRAVFGGRIHVFRNAQKTKAYQTNNNILLSKNALVNSKPQLIIDADDVKCSHGATIGQIDDNALFYLRSRGLSNILARKILILAFINEMIEKVNIDFFKEEVNSLVMQKLKF